MANSGKKSAAVIRPKDSVASRIDRAVANPQLITRALAKGVREALARHKRLGKHIVVFRNGKTVWVDPDEISLPGRPKPKTPTRRLARQRQH
jgi:hypothetical protein